MMLTFEVGGKYLRADVKELAGIDRAAKGGPGIQGSWNTKESS